MTMIVAFLAVNLVAQDNLLEKGEKVLNLGVGFGGGYYSAYSTNFSRIPLISAALDYGVKDGILDKGSIGVGGYVGFMSAKWDSGLGYGFKETDIIVGARGTFHYPFLDKLDTYAGILLAYHIVNWTDTGTWPGGNATNVGSSEVYFSGFVGARYYFNDKFAAMIEGGSGGLSVATIGISVKL